MERAGRRWFPWPRRYLQERVDDRVAGDVDRSLAYALGEEILAGLFGGGEVKVAHVGGDANSGGDPVRVALQFANDRGQLDGLGAGAEDDEDTERSTLSG